VKILNIIAGLDIGGAEMGLYRLLSRLGPAYHPHVISLSTIGEVGKHIQELVVPVQALGMKPEVPSPLAILHLVLMIKRLQPDLVHTWMYHANLIGGLASRMAGMTALTWAIRNSDLPADKTKWATRAVMRICARLSRSLPHRIISCSYAARTVHVALGYDESRFVIIPNGFDLSYFRPDPVARTEVRRELGISAGTPVIGLVARYDPQKNHKGFFEAAGILHAMRPDVHFVLAGNAIEKNNHQVAAWLSNNGIEKVTHLLGLRSDMPRLTAAFDIATSSSWSEAFSNVVGEAMACGVPCVVTDVGDSAYIVGDTGLVVKPGDAHDLAAAWLQRLTLSSEERLALGKRGRARVAENFELGSVVRRYEALYEELAGVKKRPK
jgi:glycosyltransferase involved in cell wall biosynthesis